MLEAFLQEYLVEIILSIGFLLSGPLAKHIVDYGTYRNAAERQAEYRTVQLIFRIMFAGLIVISLIVLKVLGE